MGNSGTLDRSAVVVAGNPNAEPHARFSEQRGGLHTTGLNSCAIAALSASGGQPTESSDPARGKTDGTACRGARSKERENVLGCDENTDQTPE